MANVKNLKPFKKGRDERRNVSGRPKITRLTDALRQQLAETLPDAPERTVADAIARALIKEAVGGNVQAAREIADRTEGKPLQKVDLDVQMSDWRSVAQRNGVEISDVLSEAKLLIESANDSGG